MSLASDWVVFSDSPYYEKWGKGQPTKSMKEKRKKHFDWIRMQRGRMVNKSEKTFNNKNKWLAF